MRISAVFLIIASALFSCTLFESPLYEMSVNLEEGGFYADSFKTAAGGVYRLEFSSDYALDFYCFKNREGMKLFADSSLLYSEAILFPLSYTGTYYEYEDFYEPDDSVYIYYVVDNRDVFTPSYGNSSFTVKIFK